MSSHPSRKWIQNKTKPTALDEVEEEISRSYSRKYLLRRPHPLQYEKVGEGKFRADDEIEGIVPVSSSHALSERRSKEDEVDVKELRLRQAKVTEKQRRAQ